MKIIVSPAKEMNLSAPVDQDFALSPASQRVFDALKDADLKSLLKIDSQLLEENLAYQASWSEPLTYAAKALYQGLAFRWMDLPALDADYLDDHLLILSTLYGPISPSNLIKPYRLDMQTPLKVDGKSLKTYWKPHFQAAIDDGEVVINLASNEFADLFDPSAYQWIDVDFYLQDGDQKKRHSTRSKKARGAMVKFLAGAKAQSPEAMKDFSDLGYSYDPIASTDHLYVFATHEA